MSPRKEPYTSEDLVGRRNGLREKRGSVKQTFRGIVYKDTVFEIMIVRGKLKVPVYVGQTSKWVYEKINEYCSGESHKESLIGLALLEGYHLCVRALRNDGDDEEYGRRREQKPLRTFDYAWNKGMNGTERNIVTVKMSKRPRENVKNDSFLNSSSWSSWECIVKPGRSIQRDWITRKTTTGQILANEAKVRHLFPDGIINSFGVYELKVQKGNRDVVVYVGSSADKFNLINGLKVEFFLFQIIYDCCIGETNGDLITDVLLMGYSVYARAKRSDPDENVRARKDKNELLDRYDYAWNSSSALRDIL